MARKHGKKGRIIMGTGAGAAVAALSSWSINGGADYVDVTAMEDANKVDVVGLPSVSGQFSCFYDSADRKLFDVAALAQAGTQIPMYIYPDTADTSKYCSGLAWVDFSISAAANAAVACSANFRAAGAWDFSKL